MKKITNLPHKMYSFLKNKFSYLIFNSSSSKGFTVVELLLYMGIFSILLVVLFQLFASIIDVQTDSQTTSSVTQDGRYLLNRFVYDIRRANSIVLPSPVGSSSATLKLAIGSATYTYSLSSGNILLANSQFGSQDTINSINTTVSTVSFTRVGNANGKNTIAVSLTLASKKVKQGVPNTESFKTTVGIR